MSPKRQEQIEHGVRRLGPYDPCPPPFFLNGQNKNMMTYSLKIRNSCLLYQLFNP